MPKTKKEKHSKPKEEVPFDLGTHLGLFPEDIPFGKNIGCGGNPKNKDLQKAKNQ